MVALGSDRGRLRRTLGARLFSSVLQVILTGWMVLAVAIAVVSLVVFGHMSAPPWPWYPLIACYVALWLLGVTAWAEVDQQSIRWRYWRKREIAWDDVDRVSLGRRLLAVPGYGGRPAARPAIFIVARNGKVWFIRPVEGMRGRRREFGSRLLLLARDRGVPAEVTGDGWNEPVTRPERAWRGVVDDWARRRHGH